MDLSLLESGTPPCPRVYLGFTAAEVKLYAHGGQDSNGCEGVVIGKCGNKMNKMKIGLQRHH